LKIYELEQIHRQKDKIYQAMLNEIRTGDVSPDTIDRFNDRLGHPASDADIVTIATTNKIVDDVNDAKFRALSGKEFVYEATIVGDVDQIQNQLDTFLRLKIGAQVMINEKTVNPQKRSGVVALISCSKIKRSYPCEARLLYEPSKLFSKSLAYAQTITDDIYVLSAKHGLVSLNEVQLTVFLLIAEFILFLRMARLMAAWIESSVLEHIGVMEGFAHG
jgi:hypothetical protein